MPMNGASNGASKHEHYVQVETPRAEDRYTCDAPRLTLEWKDLHLQVQSKDPTTKETKEKTILDRVNGFAVPGELLVIMGPSGAGKSTLLDCISGRNTAVEGAISVNGIPWTKSMKRFAAYVMQDDLFYATITVREHLLFQARLRMGKSFTAEQYTERVDTVMEELGLVKCRDSLIGGVSLRGISGGERKRLSFASEILTNPSLLFVDEPTSGLDSYMAETVVTQLQQLARDGRTVIATIHQPSSEIYALFDKLYLLSDGGAVYHGKASEAVNYFARLGYQCPSYINPSDYFMRELVVLDKENDKQGAQRVQRFKDEWLKHAQHTAPQLTNGDGVPLQEESADSYEDTRLGVLGQASVLARRNVVRLVRDRIAFRAGVFQTLFISLVVGLIFLQLEENQKGIQNFSGAFFFIIVNQTFSAANPTLISVPLELPIIIREYKSGLFRLGSWYVAKNLSELPMQILLPILFFVPAYFLIGIGHGFEVYVSMQVIMILVNSAAVGLGYMVSCLCRRVDIAPIIGVVIILPFLLFGGLLINSDDAPAYFVWVQYISPIKYGFESMMKIFWSQVDSLACDKSEIVRSCVENGKQVLQTYSIDRSPWVGGIILIALNLAFRTVGFLGLWFNLRSK